MKQCPKPGIKIFLFHIVVILTTDFINLHLGAWNLKLTKRTW